MELVRLADDLEVFSLNLKETRFLYQEIFEDQRYLANGIKLDSNSVVVNVGANIGLFDVFLQREWPGIRVYSFEPMPNVYSVLEANTKHHHVNARIFNCAIGREAGKATFTFYPHNSVMSSRYADQAEDEHTTRTFITNKNPTGAAQIKDSPEHKRRLDMMIDHMFEKELITCPVETLSGVLSAEGITKIDLLKIDVEKAEADVVAGMREDDWKRVNQVVMELHDIDGRLKQLERFFDERGFRVHLDQGPLLKGTNLYELYALRKQP